VTADAHKRDFSLNNHLNINSLPTLATSTEQGDEYEH